QSLRPGDPTVAEATSEIGRIVADALGGANVHAIDALLDAMTGHAHGLDHLAEGFANHVPTAPGSWDGALGGLVAFAHAAFAIEAAPLHHDTPPLA
ncbi:MAG: hypothetical protein ABIN68_05895, partial [Sphingomicrobium sp.]